jgi:hypothetical protein
VSDVKHGTYAGWNWHARHGETPCTDCRIAASAYATAHRKRHLVPIELPDERFADMEGGVGLAYAYAVRESA